MGLAVRGHHGLLDKSYMATIGTLPLSLSLALLMSSPVRHYQSHYIHVSEVVPMCRISCGLCC